MLFRSVYIPIKSGVRSLNLANVVCLATYTALVRAGVALPANDGRYEPHPQAAQDIWPASRLGGHPYLRMRIDGPAAQRNSRRNSPPDRLRTGRSEGGRRQSPAPPNLTSTGESNGHTLRSHEIVNENWVASWRMRRA